MSIASPRVLVVTKSVVGVTHLLEHLLKLGCECRVVTSCWDARQEIEAGATDLMLSEVNLPDGSAYRLIPLLLGSRTTLFFTIPLHHGCLWLPAIDRGQHCFGKAALQPGEFSRVLAEMLRERAPVPPEDSSQPARPQRQDQLPLDPEKNRNLASIWPSR